MEPAFPEALGDSDAFLKAQEELSRAALADRPLLILGERGTGKELAARKVHYLSLRWSGPFLALNCAALAPTLVEDELFGHEAGAYTGARGQRPGRFEKADGGTLVLDELGSAPLPVQEKLLRVVEYGVFERVGGSRPVNVDVRVIGATNADLPGLAADGRFKADLLDRLAFEVVILPPLREREGDVELLARHFAARMAAELDLDGPPELGGRVLKELAAYPWPGNVRELKNVVERAVHRAARSGKRKVTEVVFNPFPPPSNPAQTSSSPSLPTSLKDAVSGLERSLLQSALAQAAHNQRRAADLLGLTYHQFRALYRKHDVV